MSNLIQWPRAKYWDKAWNPVIGCKPCSPACENCYAAAMREALCEIVKRLNALADDCAVDPVEIRDIALAALAEPPRNCDNAGSWLDLYKHFHAPNGMREMPPEWVDAIAAFCQWLVATPNAKGATDGSK